ncbi:hypothetical protein LOTGIDRAFT_195769 [Lottia gigantea]|uniref:Fucosyltransferase n=1 Tax=Lottia gigantea TaxID=225164 RepID=V3ZXY4_LOTGI|nr:hypothetical protein LOTGIDRAFT_195769 [Lottia gigantea]ESO85826.1 hypothetical protein LOTGIDRAFT_195769 [Lottia gigantea]
MKYYESSVFYLIYVLYITTINCIHDESEHDEDINHSVYTQVFDASSDANYHSNPHPKNRNLQIPLIMWWTKQIYPHTNADLSLVDCGNVKCYSSFQRKYLSDPRTRGVMFYGTDIEPSDLPLPRYSHHEWALFHEESPLNNYILSHDVFLKLINHTATFSRHSDFPLTTQNIYHPHFFTERKPIPLAVKNEKRKKEKLAPILYVQTHCEVPSDRDRYVAELMKYIDIDSYGECLHNKDLPPHLQDPVPNYEIDEFLELISSYKFHLAFENAICKDYMTEKLMRPLHVGSVPIYRGSPDAVDWMPNNHSVIMVDDFTSPEQLAEFIQYLDENDEEYEKYLTFKKDGITNKNLQEHLNKRKWQVSRAGNMEFFPAFECYLCDKVTERYENEKEHNLNPDVELLPPKMANASHLGCPQPFTSLGTPEDISDRKDSWKKMGWIEMYWQGLDEARAVRNMLLNNEKNSSKFHKYLLKVQKRDN